MRSPMKKMKRTINARVLVLIGLLCALVSMPALPGQAVSAGSSTLPMMSIAVTNNSAREIIHLYLSPVENNAWGPDQMDGTALKTGQTFTITDITCSGNEIKVIAEDKDGCFMYGVISCAQASNGWIIANDTPADCGN